MQLLDVSALYALTSLKRAVTIVMTKALILADSANVHVIDIASCMNSRSTCVYVCSADLSQKDGTSEDSETTE